MIARPDKSLFLPLPSFLLLHAFLAFELLNRAWCHIISVKGSGGTSIPSGLEYPLLYQHFPYPRIGKGAADTKIFYL